MLSYDGKKIVPAPFVTITKSFATAADGTQVGSTFNITLRGTLVAFHGSPSGHYSSLEDAFWRDTGYPPDEAYEGSNEDFHSILRKQEAIRWLFARQGKSLEWQPSNGQPVVKCYPRVVSVNFEEGQWVSTCPFVVELEADRIYINGTDSVEDDYDVNQIKEVSEEWDFAEIDGLAGNGYRVTHTLSATAKIGFNELGNPIDSKTAWQHAKDWCDLRIGLDSSIENESIGHSWGGGSYTKVCNSNETGGTYAITETWVVTPGNTYVEKTFDVSYSADTDQYSVQYNGTITGNVVGGRVGDAATLAAAKAAVPSDASARTETLAAVGDLIGSATLGQYPINRTVGISQNTGTATYSFEWTTSEDATASISWEASLNYSFDTMTYGMTVSADIRGFGATPEERLENARAAVPTTEEARLKGLEILGDEVSGITIDDELRSKSISINERAGTIQCSWSWDSSAEHAEEITVQTTYPAAILAIIPIPGRSTGPVIQDMSTVTEKYVTVNYQGKGFATRPSTASIATIMDGYVEDLGLSRVIGDEDNWGPATGTYTRSRKYLIRNS